ncbi:hypothetical protein R1flu_025283 [Riccia fluitans]|uniref:Uncharacterized protein n=1 Tax=Riccia fluitans TaxID=41844 RepID=A0ABD1Y092_9MARC
MLTSKIVIEGSLTLRDLTMLDKFRKARITRKEFLGESRFWEDLSRLLFYLRVLLPSTRNLLREMPNPDAQTEKGEGRRKGGVKVYSYFPPAGIERGI